MQAPSTPWRWMMSSAPPSGDAAIAIIEFAGDVDAMLRLIGCEAVAVGDCVVRTVRDAQGQEIDRPLLARWDAERLTMMPHAGPLLMRGLLAYLSDRLGDASSEKQGAARLDSDEHARARAELPHALASAASPRAIDLLLTQPERWAAWRRAGKPHIASEPARTKMLRRLLLPPLIAVLGRPNVGKSTLLNALCQRTVALVRDEAGTTRDHVGVQVLLDGLLVRWVDLPGFEDGDSADSLAARGLAQAAALLRHADLLLLVGDGVTESPDLAGIARSVQHRQWAAHWAEVAAGCGAPASVMRVALRQDLAAARWQADASLSGLNQDRAAAEPLARQLRERLVPDALLQDEVPWRFW